MAREQRLVFGEVADLYQQARPTYPPGLYDAIEELSGIREGDPIVEVGAGTGKATEGFVARGYEVTAVEPSAEMGAVLQGRLPSVRVQQCGFEDAVLDAGRYGIVYAAQAWHWLDPVAGAHKAADALRPGGWLTLFWNRADLDGCAWHDELQPIYERIAEPLTHKNIRQLHDNTAKHNTRKLVSTERFGDTVVRHVSWVQSYTTADYVTLLGTYSNHRMLPEAQRNELHGAIAASLDAGGGVIEHPYITDLVAAPVRERN